MQDHQIPARIDPSSESRQLLFRRRGSTPDPIFHVDGPHHYGWARRARELAGEGLAGAGAESAVWGAEVSC